MIGPMSESSKLQLPYLAAGQAQKHVTVNESLRRLDALVQLSVVSANTTGQPSTPADGDVYLLPAGKSGADWGGMSVSALAYYRDGAWEEIAPRPGWTAFVQDVGALTLFDGAGWRDLSTLKFRPIASIAPSMNGELVIEATSDTSLTFKFKGSDGIVRSGALTLS